MTVALHNILQEPQHAFRLLMHMLFSSQTKAVSTNKINLWKLSAAPNPTIILLTLQRNLAIVSWCIYSICGVFLMMVVILRWPCLVGRMSKSNYLLVMVGFWSTGVILTQFWWKCYRFVHGFHALGDDRYPFDMLVNDINLKKKSPVLI